GAEEGLVDIDPVTGQDRTIRYDRQGRANVPAGSPEYFRTIEQQFAVSALEREAIAPLWEAQTAFLQTQIGDPQAGLTELQRAQRNGQMAQPLHPDATTQSFRP